MELWLAADPPFFGGPGQGIRQITELFVAFGLTALIGLERELQGKSAGIRTQTIVGTAAALILLVSKYGFSDVLAAGTVEVDPSRVAAQIVSGIGFLGAGIIIFRRGSVHGLTTAASIWESARVHRYRHALSRGGRLHAFGPAAELAAQRCDSPARHLRRGTGRDESTAAGL